MKTPQIPRTSLWTRLILPVLLALIGFAQSARAQSFVHPGLLHTQADFDRMTAQVNANAQPWKAGWDRLVANSHSQSTWNPNPQATIIRGGDGQNYGILYNDIHAAYQNALRWKISGVAAHGDKARDILNAWSATHTTLTGNADRYLAAGIYGYQFANAAEIMRGYPGFDVARFQSYLLNVYYYPLTERFLWGNSFGSDHNGACITNYWANWDQCNLAAAIAIAIFCDDRPKFDRAIQYFKTGAGNGAVGKAVPFLHGANLGQWQEAGRDQGHSTLGAGLAAAFCEMAWNQGQDMYGWDSSRIRKGMEYVAQYNRGQSVPFTTYNWGSGTNCSPMSHTVVSSSGRGNDRPVWGIISGHYKGRLGQTSTIASIEAYYAQLGTEGGGGDYGSTSGGYDQLGFGGLCFTRTGTATQPVATGTYSLRNRASGKMLDNLGATADGATVAQWADGSSNNQRWVLSYTGNYAKLQCVTGGKYLDSLGHTGNDTTVGQWANGGSNNQQWTIQDLGTGYFKIINRANGLCLDTGGATADGAVMEFWGSGGSNNQQWQFVAP